MKLDTFDSQVLAKVGKAKDIMRDIYGVDVSQRTAESQLAGIRYHLKFKNDADSDTTFPDEMHLKFAEDGSKTIEKIIILSESDMNNPNVIMERMGLDPLTWELLLCELTRKAWDVTMKLGSKTTGFTPHTATNYAFHCKVKVRPLQDAVDFQAIRAVFDSLPAMKLEEFTYQSSNLMLECGMFEPHFGKHAWEDETGETHYDLKIAEETYKEVMGSLLEMIDGYGLAFDHILFPIGQDFFHIDTTEETTTKGTHVDTDGRWQKIYEVGVENLLWAMRRLRSRAPVHVMYVPGNHDKMLSFFATLHVGAYFKDTDSVIVDTLPTPRKYHKFGASLIGFSHGKEGKRIHNLMQVEVPEDWGATKYREFHLGDLHHEEVQEEGGIIFRRISTITAPDAWHAEKGYKSLRKGQAFVWDEKRGLVTILNIPVL